MESGFVIASNSQFQEDRLVFLADRKKVSRRCWWTTNLPLAFVFQNKRAAGSKAQTLKFNSPRVLSINEAIRYVDELEFEELLDDGEGPEWDAHKGVF